MYLHSNIFRRFICINQKLERTQICRERLKNKQIVVYPQTVILLSYIKRNYSLKHYWWLPKRLKWLSSSSSSSRNMSKSREATQRKKRINFSWAELCIIFKWKLIYDNASLKSRDSKERDIIKGHEVNKKIMERLITMTVVVVLRIYMDDKS